LPRARRSAKREIKNTKKPEFFLIRGGAHWPAPVRLRHFSRKIRGYVIDGIRTRYLSLTRYLLCHRHYTLTCVYMLFQLLKYYTKQNEKLIVWGPKRIQIKRLSTTKFHNFSSSIFFI
jgi:hypothetical protein